MKRGGRQDAHTRSSSSSTDAVVASKREDKKPKRYQNPVSKSKDKSKGNKKLRYCDVSLNHRLVVYRIGGDGRGGGGGGRGYSGVSATDFAGYLSDYNHDDSDDYEEEGERLVFQDCPRPPPLGGMLGWGGEEEDGQQEEEEEEEEEEIGGGEKEDDDFGFFKVGIVVDYVVEEDWCVIGEM